MKTHFEVFQRLFEVLTYFFNLTIYENGSLLLFNLNYYKSLLRWIRDLS